jgi:hypothetical protein
MSVLDGDYILTDNERDELVWIWEQADAPKGCKVEIIEGLVTVAPFAQTSITASSNVSSAASSR